MSAATGPHHPHRPDWGLIRWRTEQRHFSATPGHHEYWGELAWVITECIRLAAETERNGRVGEVGIRGGADDARLSGYRTSRQAQRGGSESCDQKTMFHGKSPFGVGKNANTLHVGTYTTQVTCQFSMLLLNLLFLLFALVDPDNL